MNTLNTWIEEHPDLWEFIKFNVLSNVATITNFVVLWLGTSVLFTAFSNQAFQWGIFDYRIENGGLTGFLSFLLAYVCAQIVNYFVQRHFVFGANNNISSTIHWYILTVVVAGILSIVLPPYVIRVVTGWGVGLGIAQTLANVVNIAVQVVINYPMMKYVIMKKQ
ncbi:GtrA family protein [Aerococcaceae bacterium zg-BR9]|uniref:GtrA family protein n=1 Tax=Aerococcaceae bacterium zg-1292 TaxID=2774330 RepID=UPI0040638601|nr:GtrA family protein [Aerococcaceae bacterium zg-BR9]MBF6626136.1 GtrA family protein [Aerococcaceae bacterium zg-BR9]